VNTTLIPEQKVATPITADYAHTYVPNDTQTGRPSNLVVNCLDGAPYADRAAEEAKLVPTYWDGGQGGPDDNMAQAGQLLSVAENQRGEIRTSEVASQLTVGGGKPEQGYPAVLAQGIRRLTPTECERLQGFTTTLNCIILDVCLDRQKNSASVAIRSHRLPSFVGNAASDNPSDNAQSVEKSSRSNSQQTEEPAPPDVLISCGERTVEIHSRGKCCLSANFAEDKNLFPPFSQDEDFALALVGISSMLERIMPHGRAASLQSEQRLTDRGGGHDVAGLSGLEMMQLVNGAGQDSIIDKKRLKSITSSPLSIEPSDTNLKTLCYSVIGVISGYIPSEIVKAGSFQIEIQTRFGWTFGHADMVRYRQMGNAVAVPVAEWIGRRLIQYNERTL
jgi:hypothetical protein